VAARREAKERSWKAASKLLAASVAVTLIGIIASATTWSSFVGTTSNATNSIASGTVEITDNDASGALLSLSNAQPGSSSTGCVKLSYSGSLAAGIRLYANVSGALAPYLALSVTRGTESSPSFPSCSSFTADSRDYGNGPGVVYSGLLSGYPTSYGTGIADPDNSTGSPESWTISEAHSYRFVISLNNNGAAQGLSANATFIWEAQNL
jgi:hypothetical protein